MRSVWTGPAVMLLGLLGVSSCQEMDPASPNPVLGPLAEFSEAVASVQSDYLDANGAVFRSLGVLTPYLEAVLLTESAPNPGCVGPFLYGRTYDFDGSSYRVTETLGAPPDGVRFLLYDVNQAGAPMLDHPRGHLEIVCGSSAAELLVSIHVVSGSVEVLQLTARGAGPADLEWSGKLYTASGSASIPWGGSVFGDQFAFSAQLPRGVKVLYTVLNEGTGSPENVLVQALPGEKAPDWEIYADILALTSGSIMDGPVRFATAQGSHLAACMSGTLEMPTFQSAASGGCAYFGLSPIYLSGGDLNTLEGGYLVLRNLYLASRQLLGTGLAGVEAP